MVDSSFVPGAVEDAGLEPAPAEGSTRGVMSSAEREAMIVGHLPIVRMIAARISRRIPSYVDGEELVNVGVVGLIDAVDRFDPARGTPFKAYAEIRIRGAIFDSLRQSDWVPLVVRRKLVRIERTRSALRQRNGSEPDRAEMARAMGLSPEAYDELVYNAAVHHLVSLDETVDSENGGSLAERVSDDAEDLLDRWIADEALGAMVSAIEHLPEMEREVLRMYYDKGNKYREIGQVLGVCESRVCQLRSQAITRVRKAVNKAVGS